MYQSFFTLLFILLLSSTNTFAQNSDKSCPPLFTHERTIIPVINIVNVEVNDSNKFDSLPRFKGKIDIISKKIVYPEIAKRAGVEGIVKLLISLDSTGNVIKTIIMNAPGAGVEYAALDVIQKEKFYPAMIDNKNVSSQIAVDIDFDLNITVDMPEMEIDEIKYELIGSQIYHIVKINFYKEGKAYFSEDWGTEPAKEWQGEIDHNLYTHLSDFIISQCFFDYDDIYTNKSKYTNAGTRITIKSGLIEKSVRTFATNNYPVGLWAIWNLILHVKDQIKWEEVNE